MKRPEQHETDSAGKRLLREVLEGLGWTVNEIEHDYGADYEVEIFEQGASTGATFKVQLKSSRTTQYSADRTQISQPLRVSNARYLNHELRSPVVIIHCDVAAKRVFWSAPQLDADFGRRLQEPADDKSITLHIPVDNELPGSTLAFLEALKRADASLLARSAQRVETAIFVDVARETKVDIEELIRTFQAKSDALRLDEAYQQVSSGNADSAFKHVDGVLRSADSAVDDKYRAWIIWEVAELNRLIAEGASDRSRIEATNRVARELRQLTRKGPQFLRYHAATFSLAAEISDLAHRGHSLLLAKTYAAQRFDMVTFAGLDLAEQQLDRAINLTVARAVRVVNRLVRSRDAWALPTALTRLSMSIAVAVLRLENEGRMEDIERLKQVGLSVCQTAAKIAKLVGHELGMATACSTALMFSRSDDDEAFTFATGLAADIRSKGERDFVNKVVEQRRRMNRGEKLEGKIKTTPRQILENVLEGIEAAGQARDGTLGSKPRVK